MVADMLVLPEEEETPEVIVDMLFGGPCLLLQVSLECLLKNARSSPSRATCINDLLRSGLERDDSKSLPICMLEHEAVALVG